MHTHGLWINPAGNSDNVLISINPGVDFQYEYNVPTDHPAGTFWYHPHRHGSTAIQVASGMAGALIIQGNRQPSENKNGDIDTLLQATETQSFKERTLVFQQIQYACYQSDNTTLKTNPNGTYLCEDGDVGIIENYNNFGPGSWTKSGRYTSINGQVQPNFENAKVGQVERWRMIHAGIRDSINLQFRKLKDGVQLPAGMKAEEHDSFIAQNCTGEPIQQNIIAADGLTTAQIKKTTESVFQPGYRWDVLMLFPEAGNYCVIDNNASASANVDRVISPRQLLGLVKVAPSPQATGSIDEQLTTSLIDAAQKNIIPNMRKAVIDDISKGLLTKFVPHADIPATPNTQKLEFNIDIQSTPLRFLIDNEPYNPDRIDRKLVLGSSDEWVLTSEFASHPFHIHVNPFQIVKILDPKGNDVSLPDATDGGDPQYPGLKGVWKDTIWVKQGYQVVVRSRYERYIGDFVLHCHILDHEDQGMMQNVRISLPGGDAHH
jgi:FtsP/CotA-like multicopper oxidase with cupredoxin domain